MTKKLQKNIYNIIQCGFMVKTQKLNRKEEQRVDKAKGEALLKQL